MRMDAEDSSKYCVIGAGAAGLTVCRAFLQRGIEFECLERENDVGGIFNYGKANSSIYKSTHLLSSKSTTQYPDFPMPESWPPCPHHTLVLQYFRSYARHFDLYSHIRFKTAVDRIEPAESGWTVRLADGSQRHYRGVVIANGHHWDPQVPHVPGRFDGRILHSKDYKTADIFAGKRVLVVGGGNSACDIAHDAVQQAGRVFLSMRRSVHFLSKYSFGNPGDVTLQRMTRLGVPLFVQRMLAGLAARVINGRPQDLGLPAPDHRIFDANVTVNSFVPIHIRQGDITVKPSIASLAGGKVQFSDGTAEPIDVIVYATGFKVSFPFIDHGHLNWRNEAPDLYMHIFHPQRNDLAVVGLFQSATGGHWALMHHQAQLLARFLAARDHDCDVGWFRQLKEQPTPDLRGGFGRLESERQRLTVEPVLFERRLNRLIRDFDKRYDLPVATPAAAAIETSRKAA
jgi:cation diffusion facilitator CzcD-associated flavoprotein CzcO